MIELLDSLQKQALDLSRSWLGPELGPDVYITVRTLVLIMVVVAPLLGCVAYLTLWERKMIGWMQIRLGPNRVAYSRPDGGKLMLGWAHNTPPDSKRCSI